MRFLPLAAALFLLGCSSSEDKPDCTTGAPQAYVITALTFTKEDPNKRGTAAGFDLDGRVTSQPEDETCGKVDLVGPNGEKGIDNQLALFVPEIEKRVGNAIDGIIQGAINDGRLLIMMDLANVDNTTNDRCVNMQVKLAQGIPLLGTDGVVEAYQTFDLRKTDQKVSHAANGTFQNGVFDIGPFDLFIPIAIFDVQFMLHLRQAHVRFKLDANGDAEGLIGGGVSIDEIAEGVRNGAGVADIVDQIRFLGKAASDLGYDPEPSVCTLLSAALSFKARPAFVR
jgi:hypothetical protein